MLRGIIKNLTEGISFVKKNPQIVYTIFLLIVIPLAFIFTGQKFLDVSQKNQEELERQRIGILQDVLAEFAGEKIVANTAKLQEHIEHIAELNPSLGALKISVADKGDFEVVASLDRNEIGDVDQENRRQYTVAALQVNTSVIFEDFENGERHWKAFRAILDDEDAVTGVLFADISMARIDEIAKQNIKDAYYVLFFIILAIFILLFRQARIVDYAVLYKRLQEVDQMKDDFVSMAAHELKTPLAVMKGYIGLLNTNTLSDDDKQGVERIKISIERLNGLIGDILDVARIQQGRLQFSMQEIEPSQIIRQTVESFQLLAKEKGLELKYEHKELPHIFVDKDRLGQVLVNLIGNAIKYTPHGHVEVQTSEQYGVVYIRISDTGIGISAEDQKNLFQRFSRVKSRETEDISGTGLGLWITAQIVKQMKGKITVESIKGKGSDFILSFPKIYKKEV